LNYGDRWLGSLDGFLFFLVILLLLASIPWDLGSCPIDQTEYQQTEYSQTFQHNAVILQQKLLSEDKPVDFKLGHYPVAGIRLQCRFCTPVFPKE
jgi:hypothetical protein